MTSKTRVFFRMRREPLYRVLKHGVCLLFTLCPLAVRSQTAGSFAPGGQQLVLLDFATFPLGSVPVSTRPMQCLPGLPVCDIKGDLEVVMQNGVPMLRAAGRSSFVITLPQRLPSDFTLEFDLIPKTCCQPEDLAFEGTREITQSAVSANVLWHHNSHAIVGGVVDQGFSKPMPEKLSAVVMGSLTNIAFSLRGSTITMYTNGEEVYSVQREFVRGSVLRVFLGGQNDTDRAVYLARLRIAGSSPVVATNAPAAPGSTAGVTRPGRSSAPGAAAAGATSPVVASRTIPLAGFTAAGASSSTPRTFTLPAIVAAGAGSPVAHTFSTKGFTATGGSSIAHTVLLKGFQANGGNSPAPRTFSLAGWKASGPGIP